MLPAVPALFADAGELPGWRYIEFLPAEIRNPNTREAYGRALHRFSTRCGEPTRRWRLEELTPVHIAAYIEDLGRGCPSREVKQHLPHRACSVIIWYSVTSCARQPGRGRPWPQVRREDGENAGLEPCRSEDIKAREHPNRFARRISATGRSSP